MQGGAVQQVGEQLADGGDRRAVALPGASPVAAIGANARRQTPSCISTITVLASAL